jgi:hypothetical protein
MLRLPAFATEEEVKEVSSVKACLVLEGPESPELINQHESIDKDGIATFANLKFSVGSHQRVVQVYFEVTVTNARGESFTASSPYSEPFIVCTNIKQWVKAEGTVLKRVAFGDSTQVPWDNFVTAVRRQFDLAIASTRKLAAAHYAELRRRLSNRTSCDGC